MISLSVHRCCSFLNCFSTGFRSHCIYSHSFGCRPFDCKLWKRVYETFLVSSMMQTVVTPQWRDGRLSRLLFVLFLLFRIAFWNFVMSSEMISRASRTDTTSNMCLIHTNDKNVKSETTRYRKREVEREKESKKKSFWHSIEGDGASTYLLPSVLLHTFSRFFWSSSSLCVRS